jgi:hypothetical protein
VRIEAAWRRLRGDPLKRPHRDCKRFYRAKRHFTVKQGITY